MGTCFSKKSTTPFPPQAKLKPNSEHPAIVATEPLPKKEIFVIKHRISHESNGESSGTKQEADAVQIQRRRLSRSNSTEIENPKRRRRFSGSKTSFDFDSEVSLKNDELRVSSPCSRRSSERGRRTSISPNRRSESPSLPRSDSNGRSNRPVKMVSVPATDKSSHGNGGGVKRIHVKRNVSRSPTRPKRLILSESRSFSRNPLAHVDNNGGGNQKPNAKPVDGVEKPTIQPSYASLLLEDIHNFHQNKNITTTKTTATTFSLPECVNKARLIMEAVADLNSTTNWTFSHQNRATRYQ